MKSFGKYGLGLAVALVVLAGAWIAANWESDRPVSVLLARWAPPPSQFLDLAGMHVHFHDEGPRDDPAPLVLIHGTSSSLHTWEGWAGLLRDRKRVISMDLPGFGLTGPSPDGDYRTETAARFLLQLLDRLGVKQFAVAGNSRGGNVAWNLALIAPQRVERLILVDATGYAFTPASVPLGFRIARTPVLNELARNVLPRSVIESSVRNVYGDPSRVTPRLVDRIFELTLREGNRDALVQSFEQSDGGAHAELIKSVRVPTLILWGGRDRLVPPDNAVSFQRDIAGSELVIFDDLGHVPHEEDPARTVAAARAFLHLN